MSQKQLSVITITLDSSNEFQRTLRSIRAAKVHLDFEWIVVAPGLISEQECDYYVQDQKVGIYAAMNLGLSKSTGEYVFFLNAGDQILEKFHEIFLNYKCRSFDVIKCQTLYAGYGQTWVYPNNSKIQLSRHFSHQATIFKRHSNIFFNLDYSISADKDFYYKYAARLNTAIIPEIISEMSVGGVSQNGTKELKKIFEDTKIDYYHGMIDNRILLLRILKTIFKMCMPKSKMYFKILRYFVK